MERVENAVVIKVGSSSVTNNEYGLNMEVIDSIAYQGSYLFKNGYKVVVVSSGAVAAGKMVLNGGFEDNDIIDKQEAAIYGQPVLIEAWRQAFGKYGVLAGQVLLTGHDLESSSKPLLKALRRGVPIINANDPVNDEEMRQYLVASDNDQMAGYVTSEVGSRRLFLTTDVDGVKDWDDRIIETISTFGDLRRIKLHKKEDKNGKSEKGTGGMRSKLRVGLAAREIGCDTWILNAKTPRGVLRILDGEKLGTHILRRNHNGKT